MLKITISIGNPVGCRLKRSHANRGSSSDTPEHTGITLKQTKGITMSLMLHCGASLATESQVREITPVNKTETHRAVGHGELLDIVYDELDSRNIKRKEGQFGITADGECMFGLVELEEFTVPSIDARNRVFRDTPLSVKDRHHLHVRMAQHGNMPVTQMLDVEKEYEREGDEEGNPLLRDAQSFGHNVWRYLQAYTHVLQRGGRFKSENARLESINTRTQNTIKLLEKFCDHDGSRVRNLIEQEQLFPTGDQMANSYRYVLGIRNSNNMRFPAGLALGVAPFVCDNLAFSGEVTISRRHTLNVINDITKMISSSMDDLLLQSKIAG